MPCPGTLDRDRGNTRPGPGRWPARPRMPFTFLAHQAPVLPLVLLRPRWFDSVALCVGSMAPDFAYVVSGTRLGFASHTGPALLWFCLPITLVVGALVRRIWPALLVQLPLADPSRRRLASSLGPAPALPITIVSASLGAGSHVLLDAFTHPRGFGVAHWPVLTTKLVIAGRSLPIYSLLQGPGSMVLALVAIACLAVLLRRAAPIDAAPPGPPAGRRIFVACAAGGLGLGLLVALATASFGGLPAVILRFAALGFAALVLAALASERVRTPDR